MEADYIVPETRELATKFGTKPNGVVFGMKISLWAIFIFLGGQMALTANYLIMIPGMLLLGLMFAHGVELQHQALHNTGFRSRRLNEIMGVILGAPMLVSFASYQASHLRHHRNLGTSENKEFFDYGDQYGEFNLVAASRLVYRFSMAPHYVRFVHRVYRSILGIQFPGETATTSKRIRRDHLLMLLGIAGLVAVDLLTSEKVLLNLWIYPLLLVASPVHALIEIPEHYRCDTNTTDAFRNTRSITSNAMMSWFTNGNNFHVEHHLIPGAPIERLAEIHELISPGMKYRCANYKEFLKEILAPVAVEVRAPTLVEE